MSRIDRMRMRRSTFTTHQARSIGPSEFSSPARKGRWRPLRDPAGIHVLCWEITVHFSLSAGATPDFLFTLRFTEGLLNSWPGPGGRRNRPCMETNRHCLLHDSCWQLGARRRHASHICSAYPIMSGSCWRCGVDPKYISTQNFPFSTQNFRTALT